MLERATTPTASGSGSVIRPGFTFAVSRAVSTAVVTLHGNVDASSVEGLAATLRYLIEDPRNETVIVDMRDVTGADPSALALFRDAIEWAHGRGAIFRLHEPPAAAAAS